MLASLSLSLCVRELDITYLSSTTNRVSDPANHTQAFSVNLDRFQIALHVGGYLQSTLIALKHLPDGAGPRPITVAEPNKNSS